MDHLDESLLPPQMRTLIRILGPDDALALVRAWGGQRRRIGRDPDHADPELRALLPPASLRALCASSLAGRPLDLPRVDKAWMQTIHAAMRADRAAGATANQLARRYGYTARRIRQVAPVTPGDSDNPGPMQTALDL